MEDQWWRVKGGKREVLIARLAATGGLLFGLFTAASFIIILGTLSLPIGLSSSPMKGWLLIAAAYMALAAYGLYQCWVQPPFTRLVLALVGVPLCLAFVGPVLNLTRVFGW